MDEPSTGLDPASRNTLWNVVKRAKRDRAIILTSTLSLSLFLNLLHLHWKFIVEPIVSLRAIGFFFNLLKKLVSLSAAHSMEEAEVLCDRLGIFVDGSLQCIGNPKEVRMHYADRLVDTFCRAFTYEKK